MKNFLQYIESEGTNPFDAIDLLGEMQEFENCLNESENLTLKQEEKIDVAVEAFMTEYQDKGIEKLNDELTSEGLLGAVLGGLTGFALGKSIGKVIAKVLGISKGLLYDMLTSRLVGAALGAALGKKFL